MAAYQKWANDELRSLNGQIEYVLSEAHKQAGRKVESVKIVKNKKKKS